MQICVGANRTLVRGVSPSIIPTVIMKQIEGVSNDSHKNVGLVHKSTVRTSSITRIFFFFPKKYLFSQEKLRLASSILEYLKPAPTCTTVLVLIPPLPTGEYFCGRPARPLPVGPPWPRTRQNPKRCQGPVPCPPSPFRCHACGLVVS